MEKLYQRKISHLSLPSIRCVGYRQIMGAIYVVTMIMKKWSSVAFCATRQLTKRQITWLRGWKAPLNWLDSLQPQQAKEIVLRKIDEHFKG